MRALPIAVLALTLASAAHAEKMRTTTFCPGCDANFAWMNDPNWWAQNPFARATELQACRERRPGTQPMMRYCMAAMQGSAMVGRGR